jgi:hypothetical protein
MVLKQMLSAPMLLLAGGCAVVGPMVDRSYEDAPYSACAQLAGGEGSSVGQKPVRVGCFDVVARTMSAGQQISGGEHMLAPDGLRLTDAAAFQLAAGEGCTGKYFTNFVIEYSAPGGASANVTATDALGRHIGMDRIEAKASPKVRRLVMREMGDVLKNPAIAEFTDVKGELYVRNICLKGY